MLFFGSAKRQNGALSSRFLRLVGYRFGPYPDFSDSFRKLNEKSEWAANGATLSKLEVIWLC